VVERVEDSGVQRVYDIDRMLGRFRSGLRPDGGRLVTLSGIDGMDGYNPSAPIPNGHGFHILVRTEPRQAEYATWSVPFRQSSVDIWEIEEDLPMLRLEDPFCALVHGTLVVGGVRIVSRLRNVPQWETIFLRGDSLANLEEFARSPAHMKDVRLVGLEDGRIGIFTRPWGQATRFIGYTEIDTLDQLNAITLARAPLLATQPVAGQWWGANAVYNLGDGKLGILGHIARWVDGYRQYYPITFVFDRVRLSVVREPEIIADRACFPDHPAKQTDLRDVIFPAWIDWERNLFFGGLSDSAIGVLPIRTPFGDLTPIAIGHG
jgi:hypothetical protein